MRLITFLADGRHRVGALLDEDTTVLDLTAAAPDRPEFRSMLALIESGPAGSARAAELVADRPSTALIDAKAIRWCAPLPRPPRVRDCALFTEHLSAALREMARRQAAAADDPDAAFDQLMAGGRFTLHPLFAERVLYYTVDPLAISGPDDTIAPPEDAAELDYELEIAAVVGRNGSDIAPGDAGGYIFGYTICNDWSARDLQLKLMQTGVGAGVSKDFSTTLGPCLVTADEVPDPYALTMRARVNGEQLSLGSTASMTHTFAEAIAQFSRVGGVYAGEVIVSGTVASGTGFDAGRHLKPGDVVELEIDRIGTLRNRVAL
ncbi:fumarylacetoacetase-like protein [Nocardia tenerifensis]|uniref:Fumarylacetoacetase-like protein n=1 Tax=Nocardia tenerifensis TaxID=228006 RepID=A0A318KFE8_9NOCA|nr:fumarylacetoacetate hydrolase family protein [Nocardia tenerifensis]PXX58412.1 fumarylacetoacetase-like protein [Nocardia tenerifensis]